MSYIHSYDGNWLHSVIVVCKRVKHTCQPLDYSLITPWSLLDHSLITPLSTPWSETWISWIQQWFPGCMIMLYIYTENVHINTIQDWKEVVPKPEKKTILAVYSSQRRVENYSYVSYTWNFSIINIIFVLTLYYVVYIVYIVYVLVLTNGLELHSCMQKFHCVWTRHTFLLDEIHAGWTHLAKYWHDSNVNIFYTHMSISYV